MKQSVSPGLVIAAIVFAVVVIGAIGWAMRARSGPLPSSAVPHSAAAPEPNIPRPGMMPGALRR